MSCPVCATPLDNRCSECGASLGHAGFRPEVFGRPVIVIGEGVADREFFHNLAADRGLNNFEVTNPAKGKSGFGQRLRAIRASSEFAKLRRVVLARDSDLDPAAALADMQKQIRKAEGYGVPSAPRQFAQAAGHPEIAILLIPWDDVGGNLETLLWDPLVSRWPVEGAAVRAHIAGSPTGALPVPGLSKARVGCMISSVCTDDPSAAVSYMWHTDKGFRPILADQALHQVATFLAGL